MDIRKITLSAIERELLEFKYNVYVDFSGKMTPGGIKLLADNILLAIEASEIEIAERYHEISLEEASRNKPE